MRTFSRFDWTLSDNGEFVPSKAEVRFENYEGIAWLAKKGRETLGQNAAIGQQQAKTNDANSNAAFKTADSAYQQDLGSTTPGSLSPAAAAQFAADRDNISRTYNGMRQTAFSTMGERGLASAPSGFAQTTENGINQGQANNETGAYRNAQVNTQNQRNFATQGEANLSGQQGSLGASNLGQSTGAAMDQNRAGSTAGDIMGGIAEGVSAVTPFAGLFKGLGNPTSGNFNMAPGMTAGNASQLANGGNMAAIPGMNTYRATPAWQY